MVKSYLKFEHSKTFGSICSVLSNVIWDSPANGIDSTKKSSYGRAFVAANEEVLSWDLKKIEILSRWNASDNKAPVSVICRSKVDPDIFAVGYDDGKIRIWDSQTSTVIITFNGHKSGITHLKFDGSGTRLASGAKDTDVILWDLIAEVGLFKLRGHKDQITSLNFLSNKESYIKLGETTAGGSLPESRNDNFLLTTGKDALIKIWDLSTQHCVETHVAQSNGECWALGLSPEGDGCITAGNDGELKAWIIDSVALNTYTKTSPDNGAAILKERGTFYRQGKDRTIAIDFHPTRDIIAIHGSEKAVEIWRIRTEEEVRKSLNRKRKRRREKEKDTDDIMVQEDDMATLMISEVFVPYVIVRTGGKVRSMDWIAATSNKSISILVATTNNQLEAFEVQVSEKKNSTHEGIPDYSRSLVVDVPGHRTDIRCLALSSDDRMLASASQGSLKVWNTRTQSCLRTLDCGYALCATFLPGDKIIVLGTRDGALEIFDIASSTLIDTLQAHERDIWSVHVHPDGKALVTGSADKTAKFWDLKVIQEEVLGTTRRVPKLTLVHTRTLKTADDILAVRFSPDGRLLAISTLDSTVKVFFADSLKLFLTLYGHKLPVLSMDISYDSKLIVTSSADKNVRVWGLDFGDCHKTFFAHQDSIISVLFVPNNREGNGHHFFSASKDKIIKYYDGDKFEQIQALDGHHGEVWAMAVASSGEFLVSASHDKSIRIWQQCDEQIFLEEEREKELEELYESTLLTSLNQDDKYTNGDTHLETVDVGKQTIQTLMAGERIAEAIEMGMEDLQLMRQYEDVRRMNSKTGYPQRNPIFLANNNISASQYVHGVFQRIPAASLQDALLVLSFSQLPALMEFLALWASEGRNIPLTCRILFFMMKTHQRQIVNSRALRLLLEDVKESLRGTLRVQRTEIGFNLAGLRVTNRKLSVLKEHDYVDYEIWDQNKRNGSGNRGMKRMFVSVA